MSAKPKCVEIKARNRSYSPLLFRSSIGKGRGQGLCGHWLTNAVTDHSSRYSCQLNILHIGARRISVDMSPWKHLKITATSIPTSGIENDKYKGLKKENRPEITEGVQNKTCWCINGSGCWSCCIGPAPRCPPERCPC